MHLASCHPQEQLASELAAMNASGRLALAYAPRAPVVINGKTMGTPWENHGKTMGKPWETMGKLWENHGKTMFFGTPTELRMQNGS